MSRDEIKKMAIECMRIARLERDEERRKKTLRERRESIKDLITMKNI